MNETDARTTTRSIPISTVRIAGWKDGGEPVPSVESAVCESCGAWASGVWVSGRTASDGGLTHAKITRSTTVHVYTCSQHSQQVADSLVDEYGAAWNIYEPDELAQRVSDSKRSNPDDEDEG